MALIDEIYSSLTGSYQSVREIRAGVASARGVDPIRISTGAFYPRLGQLVQDGFAKEGTRELSEDKAIARGSHDPIPTYRKTGKRRPERRGILSRLPKLIPKLRPA